MSKFLGWSIGFVLVFGLYTLHENNKRMETITAELEAVKMENFQLRQQKALADEAVASTRKAMEAINAENKIYKASIEEALKASPVWAGTHLPDDLASLLQQNAYCGTSSAIPATR